MDYSFYTFYWLDSLEIRLDHNSTYYRSLSKNSDVKPRIETVSPEGTFCDTVQVPSNGGDMELI